LMQTRELSRRTAAGLSRKAHHDAGLWTGMDIDGERSYATSEWSSNNFSSPRTGHQILRDAEIGEQRQDAERRPPNVHAGRSMRLGPNVPLFPQQFDNLNFGLQTLHEDSTPGVGADNVGIGSDGVRRRGRSLSLGDWEFQARPWAVVPSQTGDRDLDPSGVGGFVDSFGHGTENESESEIERGKRNKQRRRRGSDGAAFLHNGDRGGVDVDMRPLPLVIPVETPGSWSFDTTALATDGMLHGLGIGGLPHTSEPQPQSSDTMARKSD